MGLDLVEGKGESEKRHVPGGTRYTSLVASGGENVWVWGSCTMVGYR